MGIEEGRRLCAVFPVGVWAPDVESRYAASSRHSPEEAVALTSEPGRYERRRRRERERRMLARVPEWFSADDLVPDGPAVIHGEPV